MGFTNDHPAYQIYDKNNIEAKYSDLIKKANESDIILFGELHNNPICHWLELDITQDIFNNKKGNIELGAEMFQADDQLVLDEYINKSIKDEHLKEEANLWKNYRTDYKPLVDFARDNKLSFVATNIPNRYASLVSRTNISELNKLTDQSKKWIAPLPITIDMELSAYKNMMDMFGSSHGTDLNPKSFVEAQAIKDATMAYFINKHFKVGSTFIHFNGSYHSDNYQSIYWYLKKYNPKLKIMTISSIEQEEIDKPVNEYKGLADFTINIPNSMTKTY
ncbi:MAG: ChaN family lipoprotein [Candidatus Sericytochromatia bacterium]|nr:ChaN family lipoprotein [Candidatus Sericytochromatia bacterium]